MSVIKYPLLFFPTSHPLVHTFQNLMLVNLPSHQGQMCPGASLGSFQASRPAARTTGDAEDQERQRASRSDKDGIMNAKPSPNVTRRSPCRVSLGWTRCRTQYLSVGQGHGRVALTPLTHAAPVVIMFHPI